VTDIRFSHEYVTPMAAIFFEQLVGPDERVQDPGIACSSSVTPCIPGGRDDAGAVKEGLLDIALQLEKKQRAFAEKQGIKLYGELTRLGIHGSESICHSEDPRSARRAGAADHRSDSHTPHAGASAAWRSASDDGDLQFVDHEGVRITVPEPCGWRCGGANRTT